MANEYALLADLKDTLELTGETFADADLQLGLSSASRAIDNICDRRFFLDADANQVRYYTPRRSWRLLDIDDLVTFTALDTDNDGDGVVETSWTLNSDFVFEPLNAAEDGLPFMLLSVHPNGRFRLPGGQRGLNQLTNQTTLPRSVRLTGKFGWPAVPDEIKQATVILCSRLARRSREAPFGLIGFAMETGPSVAALARQDPDVMMLVKPYVRRPVF